MYFFLDPARVILIYSWKKFHLTSTGDRNVMLYQLHQLTSKENTSTLADSRFVSSKFQSARLTGTCHAGAKKTKVIKMRRWNMNAWKKRSVEAGKITLNEIRIA